MAVTNCRFAANCWSEPMQRPAKQIGISDGAIAKHCRKLGVPVPEPGYWNKLQAGKPVTKKRTRLAHVPEKWEPVFR
jgi:hypothetical protein